MVRRHRVTANEFCALEERRAIFGWRCDTNFSKSGRRSAEFIVETEPSTLEALFECDGDGLTDFEERTFGSRPRDSDTDNDGIPDGVDQNLTRDDTPPEIEVEAYRTVGYINIRDSVDIASVDVRAYFADNGGWTTNGVTVITGREDKRYAYSVRKKRYRSDRPERIEITVTDANGRVAETTARWQPDQNAISTSLFVAGTTINRRVGGLDKRALAVGGILIIGSLAASATMETNVIGQSGEVLQESSSQIAETFENPDIGEVELPNGYVETVNGVTRGTGRAYIRATSELTIGEIGNAYSNGERIGSDGAVEYIIGSSDDESIILSIIGGTLMAASKTVSDPCNDFVNVDERGDHATRDGKPVDEVSTLRELIRNEVVKIIDVASKRYYIAQFGGGYILIASQGSPGYWIVQTVLTSGSANQVFSTIEQAYKNIPGKENEKGTVYDPEEGIDC